ncbi:trypsin-2-like [Cimex lectularius]|uniref:Peptidase S1 domain-containing protein n=1 Tax=Cimex lectularius TaxID=79782 RepID=A0A8I6RZN3_CIMLE|nr:trypsin-2-like [Cimex lectularius]
MFFFSLYSHLCVAICFVCSLHGEDYIEKKIINGRKTSLKKYPFAVSIMTTSKPHICGGSIITKTLVTSACHCFRSNVSGSVNEVPPIFLHVRAGIVNLKYSAKSEQLRYVDKIYIHPKCVITDKSLYYDIALLRISPSFIFNDYVKPISLPFSLTKTEHGQVNLTYYTEIRLYCYVAGWGKNNHENVSNDLMEVAIPLMPFKTCSDTISAVSKGNFTVSDPTSQICASVVEGKDACTGDSGSGLKCGKYLLGMVSWGVGCANVSYPAVFAKIDCAKAFFREVFLSKGNFLNGSSMWVFLIAISLSST